MKVRDEGLAGSAHDEEECSSAGLHVCARCLPLGHLHVQVLQSCNAWCSLLRWAFEPRMPYNRFSDCSLCHGKLKCFGVMDTLLGRSPVVVTPPRMPSQIPERPKPALKVRAQPMVKPTIQNPRMLNHISDACLPSPLQSQTSNLQCIPPVLGR